MNYTKQYHLPQWAESDRIMMEDFNQAMEDIETGLAEVRNGAETGRSGLEGRLSDLSANVGTGGQNARMSFGSYTGTGSYGAANARTIPCAFKPVAVLIQSSYQGAYTSVFLIRNMGSVVTDVYQQHSLQITWKEDGVSFYSTGSANAHLNLQGAAYHYVILGCSEP